MKWHVKPKSDLTRIIGFARWFMAVLKVTLFQKNPETLLSKDLLTRLAKEKSDFLILPETFAGAGLPQDEVAFEKKALDWLCNLSECTRSIIIGGILAAQEDGIARRYCPVLSDGQIIDRYYLRSRDMQGEPGIFILSGQRFAVLGSDDSLKEPFYLELAGQGIKLVFCPVAGSASSSVSQDSHFLKMAKDHAMIIVKCSATGLRGKEVLAGTSFIAGPSGITWRAGQGELQKEILKTLTMNLPA